MTATKPLRPSQKRARRGKAKGRDEENAIAKLFQSIGWGAHRVPMSGAIPGWPGDVQCCAPNGKRLCVESKRRASGDGFKTLRRWLGGKDILWLREDRCEGVVVIPAKFALELFRAWGEREGEMSDVVCSRDPMHRNWWGARYCGDCGADVKLIQRICRKCGRDEFMGRFCTLCGGDSFERVESINTSFTERNP